jgi:Ca2+-binding EF-hand superfamily protein
MQFLEHFTEYCDQVASRREPKPEDRFCFGQVSFFWFLLLLMVPVLQQGEYTLEHLHNMMMVKRKQRVSGDILETLFDKFESRLESCGRKALLGFRLRCVKDLVDGQLQYGVMNLKELIPSSSSFTVQHMVCLLEVLREFPVIKILNCRGIKHLTCDKVALTGLLTIKSQLKTFTSAMLPEERRMILRKVKAKQESEKERSESKLSEDSKYAGGEGNNTNANPSNGKNFTEDDVAKKLRRKSWSLSRDDMLPLYVLQGIYFEERTSAQQKKSSSIIPLRLTKTRSGRNLEMLSHYLEKLAELYLEPAIGNEELEAIRRFREYDTDGSREISCVELGNALEQMGIEAKDKELDGIMGVLDINRDGFVSEDEFIRIISYKTQRAVNAFNLRQKINNLIPNNQNVVHPDSPYMQWWNGVLLLVMIYIALVTPVECAFLEVQPTDTLYAINRVVDLILFKDVLLQFFLTFPKAGANKGWLTTWERDNRKIFEHYLKGWFVIDLFSSFPYDLLYTIIGDGGARILLHLKLFRILRLLKLPKVLSQERVVTRIRSILKLRHSSEMVMVAMLVIFFVIHIVACMWMLTVSMNASSANADALHKSWYVQGNYGLDWPPDLPKMYPICLYWACQTITTIGYGDVANPGTAAERWVAVIAMLIGSIIWAYLISMINSIIHFSQKADLEHHQLIETLDQFATEKGLGTSLKQRLKIYFEKRQSLERTETYQSIIAKCPAALRGEVAKTLTGAWIMKVSWLRFASETFVTSMALLLKGSISPPLELISGKSLHVMVRGVAIKDMRVHCSGMVWGLDMVLCNTQLRRQNPAVALTFVETLALERKSFIDLLDAFPFEKKRVRRATIWLAFKRKFLRHAQEIEMLTDQVHTYLAKEFGGFTKKIIYAKFKQFDKNNDGSLDLDDFADALRVMGFIASQPVVENILSRFDKDGDGTISVTEFVDFFFTNSGKATKSLGSLERRKSDMFSNMGGGGMGEVVVLDGDNGRKHESKREAKMAQKSDDTRPNEYVLQGFNEQLENLERRLLQHNKTMYDNLLKKVQELARSSSSTTVNND